jgi:hypothetical protein
MTLELIKLAIAQLRAAYPTAGHIGVTLDCDQFTASGQIEAEYWVHICPKGLPRITLHGPNLVSLVASAMATAEGREQIIDRVNRESRLTLN